MEWVRRVMSGEKLQVTVNPYVADAAQVLLMDADGHEVLHSIPLLARDEAGFLERANVINEDYARPADTVLDTNRKEVQRFTYDAVTDEEAEAKRKAGAVPFASRIDPYKVIAQAPERTYLPKAGVDMATNVLTTSTPVPARVLSPFEASAWLRNAGVEMDRIKAAQVRSWFPDGVPEDQLTDLQARLAVRSGLRVVAGGGA